MKSLYHETIIAKFALNVLNRCRSVSYIKEYLYVPSSYTDLEGTSVVPPNAFHSK
jgi:hypothetical protein